MSEMWKIVRKMTNHIQCNDCDLLVSACRGISTACQEKGVNLAIGLGLNLPGVAGYGHRCPSFADLKNVLHDLKQESEAASSN
jgi:hypothetical protein